MSNHTPGPWLYEEAIGDAESGETLWYTIESENGELIAGWCGLSDAPLLAAAPAMLSALESAVHAMPLGEEYEAAVEAIAKAKK